MRMPKSECWSHACNEDTVQNENYYFTQHWLLCKIIIKVVDCPYVTGLHAGVGSEEKPQKNLNWNILILF